MRSPTKNKGKSRISAAYTPPVSHIDEVLISKPIHVPAPSRLFGDRVGQLIDDEELLPFWWHWVIPLLFLLTHRHLWWYRPLCFEGMLLSWVNLLFRVVIAVAYRCYAACMKPVIDDMHWHYVYSRPQPASPHQRPRKHQRNHPSQEQLHEVQTRYTSRYTLETFGSPSRFLQVLSVMVILLFFCATPSMATDIIGMPTCQVLSCIGTWGGVVGSMASQARINLAVLPDISSVNTFPVTPTGAVRHFAPDTEEFQFSNEQLKRDSTHLWSLAHHPESTPEQRQRFYDMLADMRGAFAYSTKELPGYNGESFRIDLTHDRPIVDRPRRRSPLEQEILKEKGKELKEAGIIRSVGTTNYVCNPVLPVKKDSDGNYTERRFCVNFIPLNEVTEVDRYQMPLPEDLFQRIGTRRFISKMDMRAGFHQIPIAEEDQEKTSFYLGNEIVCYQRMPMGLRNATAAFCRIMDREIAAANLQDCALPFVDDVLIASDTFEQHVEDVQRFLQMLIDRNLRAHPEKSYFCTDTIEFLGHQVSAYGLTPHEAKIQAILALPIPKDVADLRSILGFFNYYRCYVPNYATIAKPLYNLLTKASTWLWGEDQHEALEELRHEICTEGRAVRRAVPDLPYLLYTDWSKFGIGAVLAQRHPDGHEYMVACISRSLNTYEGNYAAYDGELLAAVWATKILRPYLHGTPFTLVTDHQALTYLLRTAGLVGRHARWQLMLQDLELVVAYRPGISNANADVPSRFPRGSAFDNSGARLDGHPADRSAVALVDGNLATNRNIILTYAELNSSSMVCLALHPTLPAEEPIPDSTMGIAAQQLSDTPSAPPQQYHQPNNSQHHLQERSAWPAGVSKEERQPKCKPLPLTTVNPSFFKTARDLNPDTGGCTVVELCGGLCAGLEAALHDGYYIKSYLYCDICPIALKIASRRVAYLQERYPRQFHPAALEEWCTALPGDVFDITLQHLQSAGLGDSNQPWLVIAGWECQDLSAAGSGRGLYGQHSRTFWGVMDVVHLIMQHSVSSAYILENSATLHNFNHSYVRNTASQQLRHILGQPVTLDAAKFSRAHRLRDYWSNMAPPSVVSDNLQQWTHPPNSYVDDILELGRSSQEVTYTDKRPWEPVNVIGEPRRALPTIVSFPGSHSYRDDRHLGGQLGAGLLWTGMPGSSPLDEPTAVERARAMGYDPTSLAAPNITEQDMRLVLGRCIDQAALRTLFHTYRHSALAQPPPPAPVSAPGGGHRISVTSPISTKIQFFDSLFQPTTPVATHKATQGVSRSSDVSASYASVVQLGTTASDSSNRNLLAAARLHDAADAKRVTWSDSAKEEPAAADVWGDAPLIHLLRYGELPTDLHPAQRQRIIKRSQRYHMLGSQLYRTLPDGSTRLIPPPGERQALIEHTHKLTGHFGINRTAQLLATSHWWHGMVRDTAAVVKHCEHCQRVKASFSQPSEQLRPLPIAGLFYRWGVDLAGPFPMSKSGSLYAMIMVEHYSKHLLVVGIPNKEAHTTRAVFLVNVIGRYGSCAEVVTDGGREFEASFSALLTELFIDHRITQPNNPKADGLAERAVQTIKQALRKIILDQRDAQHWDTDFLPWLSLGYNCSRQQSTGFSPYFMLHGVEPVIPPAIKTRMDPMLELSSDSLDLDSASLLDRVEAIQQAGVLAGGNLLIAQHRDTLRYANVRSGSYTPRLRRFAVGDYVYLQVGQTNHRLDTSHYSSILRVQELLPSGNLLLVGRCGRTYNANPINCAPCHLANIDPNMDAHLPRPAATHPCQICQLYNRDWAMVMCDACNKGYHFDCLGLERPPPEDPWRCTTCEEQDNPVRPLPPRPTDNLPHRRDSIFLTSTQRKAFKEAALLDGTTVYRTKGNSRGTAETGIAQLRPVEEEGSKVPMFDIYYDDGEIEEGLSRTKIRNRQVRAVVSTTILTDQRWEWNLLQRSSLLAALQFLMPGEWAARHVSILHKQLHQFLRQPHHQLPIVPTMEVEITPLLQHVDFSDAWHILDPFSGNGTVASIFSQVGLKVWTNDLNPTMPAHTHHNALDLPFYTRRNNGFLPDAIVTSPWFGLLDIAIPLLVHIAKIVACIHVPGHYFSDAHSARSTYLQRLASSGRLHILWNLPRGPSGRRCAWMLVFKDQHTRKKMIGHLFPKSVTCSYV